MKGKVHAEESENDDSEKKLNFIIENKNELCEKQIKIHSKKPSEFT